MPPPTNSLFSLNASDQFKIAIFFETVHDYITKLWGQRPPKGRERVVAYASEACKVFAEESVD